MIIKVYGMASQQLLTKIEIDKNTNTKISLMSFLISNNITIASSCNGVGACKKCIINDHEISCQISLSNFLKNNEGNLMINISYL